MTPSLNPWQNKSWPPYDGMSIWLMGYWSKKSQKPRNGRFLWQVECGNQLGGWQGGGGG